MRKCVRECVGVVSERVCWVSRGFKERKMMVKREGGGRIEEEGSWRGRRGKKGRASEEKEEREV